MNLTRLAGRLSALQVAALGLLVSLGSASPCQAGAPEYMKLKSKPGMAMEIKGAWGDGVFVAEEIELLPNPRSPRLRGAIADIDRKAGYLTLFGRRIAVTEVTEFVQDGSEALTWDKLQKGQRVEVSCKVDSANAWSARKISTQGIKSSDKIKGTITRLHMDGESPDTLDMSGLLILLKTETDILEAEGALLPSDKELFGDLGRESMEAMPLGWPVGDFARVALQYRLNAYDQSEYDLTTSADTDLRGTQHQVRSLLSVFAGEQLRFHANLRLQKTLYHLNERGLPEEDASVYFTELFALLRPRALKGVTMMVGRQRFREPREWLFDEYLDAVRVFYHAPMPLVFEGAYIHAVAPIKEQFSTWTDLFFRVRWYTDEESRVAAYVLARRDSDESRKRQPIWFGLRYVGQVNRFVRGWADLSMQRGEDKFKNVEAWAVDVGTTLTAERSALKPALSLAYAASSGDDTGADDIDHTYRQTGYEDNSDHLSGISRTKYYGNLLDPELSNLRVFTAGVGLRPTRRSSVEVAYHTYTQSEPDADLNGSDLVDPPARPNGTSPDLGWALDLVVRFPKMWNTVSVKWTSAMFNPGVAYEPRKETSYLNQLNLTVEV